MTGAVVRPVPGVELLWYTQGLRAVHADAFGGPPWREGPERADAYLERLAEDIHRPGFAAALALDRHTVVGWTTAWTTPAPSRQPLLPGDTGRPGRRTRGRPAVRCPRGGRTRRLRPRTWRRSRRPAAADGHRGPVRRTLPAADFGRHPAGLLLLRAGRLDPGHPSRTRGRGHAVFLGPRHPARTAAPAPFETHRPEQ